MLTVFRDTGQASGQTVLVKGRASVPLFEFQLHDVFAGDRHAVRALSDLPLQFLGFVVRLHRQSEAPAQGRGRLGWVLLHFLLAIVVVVFAVGRRRHDNQQTKARLSSLMADSVSVPIGSCFVGTIVRFRSSFGSIARCVSFTLELNKNQAVRASAFFDPRTSFL